MPSNTKASAANGIPDHLAGSPLPSVAEERASSHLPRPDVQQYLPASIQGLNIPLDPLLEWAGAFYNEQRVLVRKVCTRPARAEKITDETGRVFIRRYEATYAERLVAPPGMTLEQARANGLDFFNAQYGWVRAGLKLEREHVENLGTGGDASVGAYTDTPVGDLGMES